MIPPPLLAAWWPSLTELWPLALPLLLGGVAVYLLLPRPQPYPTAYGAVVGTFALVLAALLVVRVGGFSLEAVLFYLFSAVAIVSGAVLIAHHSPPRAALSFTLVVLSSTGLFLLLAAPFLMAATIIIYAGAIVVTFLFVLMLAQQTGLSDADARSREPALAAITGFVLLGVFLYVLRPAFDTSEFDALLARVRHARAQPSVKGMQEAVGKDERDQPMQLFHDFEAALRKHDPSPRSPRVMGDLLKEVGSDTDRAADRWIRSQPSDVSKDGDEAGMREALGQLEAVALEARSRVGLLTPTGEGKEYLSNLSGPSAAAPQGALRRDPEGRPAMPAENSAHLGKSLFTDYLLPVELGGLLLLVATVGAILIAHRHQTPGRPS